MKIDRKELLKALRITHHATKNGGKDKAFPFEKFVMLDGLGQCVRATNLELYLRVPLEITIDSTPVVPALPDDDMLEGLKIAQMKSLADDYAIPIPSSAKKADDIRDSIMETCKTVAIMEAEKAEGGKIICLPAKDLANILITLNDETVELNQDEDGFVSIGEKFHSLRTFPANEFPSNFISPEKDDAIFAMTVPMGHLEHVAITVKGTNGGNFSGILFDTKEGYVVGTDGHRLHRTPLKGASEEKFYVPSDVIPCLKSIFGKDGTVELSYWSGNIQAKNADGASVAARCPSSMPFDWKTIMTEGDKEITISKKDFQKPLAQAQALSDSSYRSMKLKFNGGIEMEMTHPNKGEYQNLHIPIKGKNYGDDVEVTVCLDSYFFMDVLCIAEKDDDEIKIGFSDASHPISFKHKDLDGLIMPMRF